MNKNVRFGREVAKKISVAAMCAAFIFSLLPSVSFISFAASPGDIIINEFVSNGDEWVELLNISDDDVSLSGFTLSELENPQTVPAEILLLELSGTIPAHGILVFDVLGAKLNNEGDSIALYNGAIDNPANLWQRATYGSVAGYAAEAGLETASTGGQSAAFADSSWSVDSSPSKGWFNDAGEPGKAPLLSGVDSIESFLDTAGISSNIGELDNPSETPDSEGGGALYFEKEGRGKIVFETTLNLSDQDTVAVLQELGEKMEMSDGHIEFDSATADAMNATGAKIYMYELDFTSTPNIIVKDDEGDTISGTGIIEDVSYNPETGELSFTAAHFTQFEVDDNVYVDVNHEGEEDGTEANPFTSIQDGIDAVPTGGTVHVASGNYYGDGLEIEKSLTLLGNPGNEEAGPEVPENGGAPLVYDDSDCEIVVSIEADDVTVKGFVLYGNGCERPVMRVGQGISGAVISDNEIKEGEKGVDLSPESSHNTVTNNLIHDNDNEGVWIGGSTDNSISDNEIYGNSTGIGLGAGGCSEECVGGISGNEIIRNNVHNNGGPRSGIHVEGEDVSFSELTIRDNNITENGGYGIYFDQVNNGELTISDNEITDNGAAGIYISGDDGRISNSSAVSLKNNTISNNAHEGVYIGWVEEESTLDIIGNTITENNGDSDEVESDYPGVYINYVNDSAVTLRDNTISDHNLARGVYACADGCSLSSLTFKDNTVENNNSDGILVSNLRSGTLDVLGNTVKGTAGPGFELAYSGNGGDTPPTVTISENTFDGNFYGIYIGGSEAEGDEADIVIAIGENNIIENNDNTGIFLGSPVSGVTITGNTIQNNGVESETTGIVVQSASGNSAHNNSILGNGSHGVNNTDEEGNVFDAERNWWGDATGPLHETQNPDGAGNAVSDNVTFSPWFADSDMTILGNTTTEGEDDTLTAILPSDILMIGDVVGVEIPAGIIVTGPSGWDGTINLPVVIETTVPPVPDSGNDADAVGSIEIGFGDTLLTFDKGVRLFFVGQAGNDIGYSHGAGTFTPITAVCSTDSQEAGDALDAGADCKIDVGDDLVVWTNHFSVFTTYTQSSTPAPTPAPGPSGGSGGGGGGWGGGGGIGSVPNSLLFGSNGGGVGSTSSGAQTSGGNSGNLVGGRVLGAATNREELVRELREKIAALQLQVIGLIRQRIAELEAQLAALLAAL